MGIFDRTLEDYRNARIKKIEEQADEDEFISKQREHARIRAQQQLREENLHNCYKFFDMVSGLDVRNYNENSNLITEMMKYLKN